VVAVVRDRLAVHTSDGELMAASLERSEVFAELFDRHSGTVFRYAAQRLGEHAAEDLVGETFLVAFERRAKFDPAFDDARPWLLGIATKLISRRRRTEATHFRALLRSPREVAGEEAADRVAARVSAAALRPVLAEALAGLAARDRDVLLLIGWAELSYEQAALALDIPVGTVRSRLNRARRKLRAALGETNPLDEQE
jgi:RNA polymerase sigma-70 factor (ECF subfamily)